MWNEFLEKMNKKISTIDKDNYGVIGSYSYYLLDTTINELKTNPRVEVFQYYENCDKTSYFISPTIVLCNDKDVSVLKDEFFGPILGVRLYKPENIDEIIRECQTSVPYALTGAIFSENSDFLEMLLNYSAKIVEICILTTKVRVL